MKTHDVSGGGGLRLHVREWGLADGPAILFIHGWSQCHLCWAKQYESSLADRFRLVAFDNRGHGMSKKPLGPEHYTNSRLWADDVASVIQALGLNRPLLVAWSYAGLIVCDYLREHGREGISGINFVAAAVTLNAAAFGPLIGPGFFEPFADATADDLPRNIQAMRRFLRGCVQRPLSGEVYEAALCWNMVVPPEVRAALADRTVDFVDVLKAVVSPVLVSHGREDLVRASGHERTHHFQLPWGNGIMVREHWTRAAHRAVGEI